MKKVSSPFIIVSYNPMPEGCPLNKNRSLSFYEMFLINQNESDTIVGTAKLFSHISPQIWYFCQADGRSIRIYQSSIHTLQPGSASGELLEDSFLVLFLFTFETQPAIEFRGIGNPASGFFSLARILAIERQFIRWWGISGFPRKQKSIQNMSRCYILL